MTNALVLSGAPIFPDIIEHPESSAGLAPQGVSSVVPSNAPLPVEKQGPAAKACPLATSSKSARTKEEKRYIIRTSGKVRKRDCFIVNR